MRVEAVAVVVVVRRRMVIASIVVVRIDLMVMIVLMVH